MTYFLQDATGPQLTKETIDAPTTAVSTSEPSQELPLTIPTQETIGPQPTKEVAPMQEIPCDDRRSD